MAFWRIPIWFDAPAFEPPFCLWIGATTWLWLLWGENEALRMGCFTGTPERIYSMYIEYSI
jgi:hypothetical protein